MSIYNFAPMPTTEASDVDFVTWENAFTPAELDALDAYATSMLPVDKAIISGMSKDEEYAAIRKSKTGWLALTPDTTWVYDRLAYVARLANAQYWRFDLGGFVEDFQYTVYDEPDDHYSWHMDTVKQVAGKTPRKLSMVLQLSDPADYSGGDLQIKGGPNDTSVKRERGLITIFPSYMLHRVTPLESGVRKSLVVWISGPPFK
jgi:PKHD-type hydroxylase